MIIAVNTSSARNNIDNTTQDFIITCFIRLAQQNTADRFLFFSAYPLDDKKFVLPNITTVMVSPLPKNNLRLHYHFNYALPALLRKHKADVCISIDSCALRTTIPQCLIIDALPFLQQRPFFKKNNAVFLNKATVLISTSQAVKEKIIEQYTIDSDKIDVACYPVNNDFKALQWQQRDNIRSNFSGGLEYFLYSGPVDAQQNLINLLKAFSFFKKRQKSNMQLLLVSTTAGVDQVLVKSLATYKYRDEVKIINNLPQDLLVKITAAAYALVYPSTAVAPGIKAALQAFKSEVPLIISRNDISKEICADAALYIDPNDFNDIADKIMLVFKDENKRHQLIVNGRRQADLYDEDNTIAIVWAAVLKAVNKPII